MWNSGASNFSAFATVATAWHQRHSGFGVGRCPGIGHSRGAMRCTSDNSSSAISVWGTVPINLAYDFPSLTSIAAPVLRRAVWETLPTNFFACTSSTSTCLTVRAVSCRKKRSVPAFGPARRKAPAVLPAPAPPARTVSMPRRGPVANQVSDHWGSEDQPNRQGHNQPCR